MPSPRPADCTTRLRRRLARYLHTYGPTPVATLAAALGLRPREVRGLTNHRWFRITGDGWALAGSVRVVPRRTRTAH